MMSRPGLARPVVIKMDADIGEDIVRSKMRTLGISRNRFDELLSQVRGSKKPKRKKKNRCPSTLPLAEGLTPPAGKCVLLRSWTRMVHAARPWTNAPTYGLLRDRGLETSLGIARGGVLRTGEPAIF